LLQDFCQKLVEQTQEGQELKDKEVIAAMDLMKSRFGYPKAAVRDAAARLLRARFG
jgi:hypothetical protein